MVTYETCRGVRALAHWPFLLPGILDWASSREMEIADQKVCSVDAVTLIYEGLLSEALRVNLIYADEELVGFDVVSHGLAHPPQWVDGCVTWIRPESRGEGFWGLYVDALVANLGELGTIGFRFTSTLPFWEILAPRYGFQIVDEKEVREGVVARTYIRRA